MEFNEFEKRMGKMTTMEVSGRVTNIAKAETKSGKPFWKVFVDGQEGAIFAWAWGTIADIKVGQGARLEVEDRNGFLHIIKAEPTSPDAHPDNPEEEVEERAKPAARAYVDNKQNNPFITRMSCLKTAVDYLSNCTDRKDNLLPGIEEVIATAARFAEYVENGDASRDL